LSEDADRGKAGLRIWVDADACPQPIRQILCRAAERERVAVVFVANRPPRLPRSQYVRSLKVSAGFDVADRRIADSLHEGDLVVTADVPLAAEAVARGALALDPRGELYTEDNVQERLAVRDLMDQLRGAGVETGGPSSFGASDRQAFANQLDRLLTAHRKDRDD